MQFERFHLRNYFIPALEFFGYFKAYNRNRKSSNYHDLKIKSNEVVKFFITELEKNIISMLNEKNTLKIAHTRAKAESYAYANH